ncbi:MAG: alpha/beta hydrolase family protein [Planctomycetota bacterium]|jgi:dienelactone hydrolase
MCRSICSAIETFALLISFLLFPCPLPLAAEQVPEQFREEFSRSFPIRKQQHIEVKEYVDRLISERKQQALDSFKPDFTNATQYEKSLSGYRKRHADNLGYPPPKAIEGAKPRFVYVGKDSVCNIYRMWVEVAEGVNAYGIYMVPHNIEGKAPLLICVHGGGGNPEAICDLDTRVNYYSMGHEAVKRGYCVWAPGLIMRCVYGGDPKIDGADRGFFDRKLTLLGTGIIGLELHIIIESTKALLRYRPEIDADRVAMTGLSWGGYYTLHTTAIFPLVKVAVPSANFREQAAILSRVDDPVKRVDRDIFRSFGDAQVAGMICPRPLMIQMGAKDTLFDLEAARREAKKAASFYKKLGIEDSFEFSVHPGGHVFEIESIFKFLDKHLAP